MIGSNISNINKSSKQTKKSAKKPTNQKNKPKPSKQNSRKNPTCRLSISSVLGQVGEMNAYCVFVFCCFTWNCFLALPVTTSVYRIFFFQNARAVLVLVPKLETVNGLNVCFLQCDNIDGKLFFV